MPIPRPRRGECQPTCSWCIPGTSGGGFCPCLRPLASRPGVLLPFQRRGRREQRRGRGGLFDEEASRKGKWVAREEVGCGESNRPAPPNGPDLCVLGALCVLCGDPS